MSDAQLQQPLTDGASTSAPRMGVMGKLSFLDRFLTLWIVLAAGAGLGLGQINAVQSFIDDTTVGSTNVLVAVGLLVMMYPPLAKVRWNLVHRICADWRLLLLTTVQNWVLGPFVMFFLSSAFFSDDVGYMTGLSLVGCARCIAMVVVWNSLAGGDAEYCAAIVAMNSVLTIGLYSPYAGLFINDLPSHLGIDSSAEIHVAMGEVAKNVGIYMGAPFVAALLTWYALTKAKGDTWYFDKFTPRIGVLTLMALLFTIVVLFASQSTRISSNLGKVIYAAVPLLIYFMFMFVVSFLMSWWLGATYEQAVTLSFTAASNNFELALAVAIASFGLKSDPALMSVVGALIEIPTMLALVYLAFWFRKTLFATKGLDGEIDPVEEMEGQADQDVTGIYSKKTEL
ncbi:Arsenite resistance protein [Phytophthora rubi]|uniref:Arsenite resistance protein n=1 Tax=Phytophthora rubi TaxID=129364 RepID=A0A6A3MMC4_9STRA|nr:Arsenite resistance protein [Phytophthora rubi]KAE9043123.1 Arsenite resistance protein [Phytophthora rubi]KAE9354275.1 Arsenite resistance protein [Phytophthora rubi]